MSNKRAVLAGNLTLEQLQGIRAYWEGSIQRRKNAEYTIAQCKRSGDNATARQARISEAYSQGQLQGMEQTLHLIFGIDPHAIITIAKNEADPPTMPDPIDKARENLRAEAEKTTPRII